MEVIVRLQGQEHCASITCMIKHYAARRAKVTCRAPGRRGRSSYRFGHLPSSKTVAQLLFSLCVVPWPAHHPGPGSSTGLADPPPWPASRWSHQLGRGVQRDPGAAFTPAMPGTTERGRYRKTAREGDRLQIVDFG